MQRTRSVRYHRIATSYSVGYSSNVVGPRNANYGLDVELVSILDSVTLWLPFSIGARSFTAMYVFIPSVGPHVYCWHNITALSVYVHPQRVLLYGYLPTENYFVDLRWSSFTNLLELTWWSDTGNIFVTTLSTAAIKTDSSPVCWLKAVCLSREWYDELDWPPKIGMPRVNSRGSMIRSRVCLGWVQLKQKFKDSNRAKRG